MGKSWTSRAPLPTRLLVFRSRVVSALLSGLVAFVLPACIADVVGCMFYRYVRVLRRGLSIRPPLGRFVGKFCFFRLTAIWSCGDFGGFNNWCARRIQSVGCWRHVSAHHVVRLVAPLWTDSSLRASPWALQLAPVIGRLRICVVSAASRLGRPSSIAGGDLLAVFLDSHVAEAFPALDLLALRPACRLAPPADALEPDARRHGLATTTAWPSTRGAGFWPTCAFLRRWPRGVVAD